MSENGEQAARREAYRRRETTRSERSVRWPRHDHDSTKRYVYKMVDSPVGQTHAGGDRRGPRRDPVGERPSGSRAAEHRGGGRRPSRCWSRPSASSRSTLPDGGRQFALTLDLAGTPFQRKVWNALLTIPFGETRSYAADRAGRSGIPSAVRAVGAANGRNPVSIVAPCHRVDRIHGRAHRIRRRPRRQSHICWRWKARRRNEVKMRPP